MKCDYFRHKIHEFLDGELAPPEGSHLLAHIEGCRDCRQRYEQFAWVKQALSPSRLTLSAPAQEELWGRLRSEMGRNLRSRLSDVVQDLRNLRHEFDLRSFWSRIAAVPVTLVFFIAILVHFSPLEPSQWDRPVVSTLPVFRLVAKPVVTQVSVHYRTREIDDLMSVVWKIPYEDELSLLAEITPEGRAETENVLQYPKNHDLLRAVNLALQESEFEAAGRPGPHTSSFVIYSFQKVDVYEEKTGL